MKTNFACKIKIVLLGTFLSSFIGFSQETPHLNDAEIASVAVTANQIDVDYGKIAVARSQNEDVLEFANTMIDDHNAVIKMAVDLVTKLGVAPQDNKMSQSLLKQAAETSKKLKNAKPDAFDKMYIDNEVAYHQAVINAVKDVLIPQTQNAELKELLQTALPILETHLDHAKMAQSNIPK